MSPSSPPTRKPADGPKNRASMSKSTSILLCVVIPILLVILICTVLTILAIIRIVPMPQLSAFLTFRKYLLAITAPFLPFLLAGLVGFTMKVWKRRAFGGRTNWLLILGGQACQHLGRVVGESMDMEKVFTAWGEEGIRWDKFLLGMKGWVQWGLIVFVVWGEVMGRRWDGGYVEKLVDGLVKEEEEKLKQKMVADEEMGAEVDQEVEFGEDGKGDMGSEKDSEKASLL